MVQAVQSLRSVQFLLLNPPPRRGGGQRWGLNGFNGLNGLNLQGRETELSRVIRDMPRDEDILELLKKFSGAGPLPAR